MANDQRPPYDAHDFEVMANNIFHELCELDRDARGHERPPAWHDITVTRGSAKVILQQSERCIYYRNYSS